MTTYGPVNPLETEPRYVTLAAVKRQIGINDAAWDTEVTQAIVAMELMMDVYMSRSFPDTGDDPAVPGIPQSVSQAALLGSIELVKLADGPSGVAGSDSFVGEWDMGGNRTRRAFDSVKPILRGFRVGDWGGFA